MRLRCREKVCIDKGSSMNENEPGKIADNTRADSEKQDIPKPWPYLSELFK